MIFIVITQVYTTENKKALHTFSERNLRDYSVNNLCKYYILLPKITPFNIYVKCILFPKKTHVKKG